MLLQRQFHKDKMVQLLLTRPSLLSASSHCSPSPHTEHTSCKSQFWDPSQFPFHFQSHLYWAISDFSLLTMTAFITQLLNFEASIFSFSCHTCQKLSVNTCKVMFGDFWNSGLTWCLQKPQINTLQFLSEVLTVRLHILLTCAGTFLISSAGVVSSLWFM